MFLSLRPSLRTSNLLVPSGDSFSATPDARLNTCTGTISISPQDCPIDDKACSDCHTDLLDLLSEYDAVSVRCYTLSPRGRQKIPTNVARIIFQRHDPPTHVYVGGVLRPLRPYVLPPRQCRNCWRFGHPEKHCRSALRCPLCDFAHIRDECPATTQRCCNSGGLSTAAALRISLRLRSLVLASVTVSRYVRPARKPVA